MIAQDVLNILNCLNKLIDLREYKIITTGACVEGNSGFYVNTSNKIIVFIAFEEE